MKDEIVIDGVLYVRADLARVGEIVEIMAVVPIYTAHQGDLLDLRIRRDVSAETMVSLPQLPLTRFKPGEKIKISKEGN